MDRCTIGGYCGNKKEGKCTQKDTICPHAEQNCKNQERVNVPSNYDEDFRGREDNPKTKTNAYGKLVSDDEEYDVNQGAGGRYW